MFQDWLKRAIRDDNRFGDVARTIALDIDLPDDDDGKWWDCHFRQSGASVDFLKAWKEAWDLYVSDKDLPDPPSKLRRRSNVTHEDTIEMPILPNYGENSRVVRICADFKFYDDDEILPLHQWEGYEGIEGMDFSKEPSGFSLICNGTYRVAVEQLAVYFKREFRYDFVQYRAKSHLREGDENCHPYLFLSHWNNSTCIRPVGACCFYKHDKWRLHWVWFHPFHRRHGYLTNAWKRFRCKYGDFGIVYPISDAMLGFLKKIGEDF